MPIGILCARKHKRNETKRKTTNTLHATKHPTNKRTRHDRVFAQTKRCHCTVHGVYKTFLFALRSSKRGPQVHATRARATKKKQCGGISAPYIYCALTATIWRGLNSSDAKPMRRRRRFASPPLGTKFIIASFLVIACGKIMRAFLAKNMCSRAMRYVGI